MKVSAAIAIAAVAVAAVASLATVEARPGKFSEFFRKKSNAKKPDVKEPTTLAECHQLCAEEYGPMSNGLARCEAECFMYFGNEQQKQQATELSMRLSMQPMYPRRQ
ncbi:hypothetical protein SYNPS1DRAFT_31093 [Syncephalis pseudoplumigaleata]|uniref:Uncharacterized protein n=1 Tax=Syncephalis pseudoplumigaleata TaxID=1712513 RepID=A0A4P9YTE7_9FUNG|nr:hypothetical protein SYNPS1DRAFT_31093 [Syncephalis pseudoplumigaleata]|eukprot:RKP23196.1 hypothetical protein SYNPS1DRAFT_31093 [Syncephalis pseudoplumigaleata]